MQYIEFIGLPGSGKSTIRNRLVTALKNTTKDKYFTADEAFLRVSQKHSDFHFRVILKLLPPATATKFIDKFINRSQMQFLGQNQFLAKHGHALNEFLSSKAYATLSTDDRANVIGSFLETGSVYECIKKQSTNDSFIFFEEGLVQKSFMFTSQHTVKNIDTHRIEHYLSNIPLPNYLTYVKADPQTCFKRMKARPTGLTNRLNKQDESDIFTFLENATAHLEHVVNYLKANTPITIVELDNTLNISQSIEKLTPLFLPTNPDN